MTILDSGLLFWANLYSMMCPYDLGL